MDTMFMKKENIDMEEDFVKHNGDTLDLHIKVECNYPDLPSTFIIDEVVNAINSKIRIMSVKEISLINIQVKRIYGSRI